MTPFSQRIHDALDFASLHHSGQTRKDPDVKIPYVSHLFGVAYILAAHDYGEDVVVAGILHDLLEDIVVEKRRPAVGEEMKRRFGEGVYELVSHVTQRKRDERGRERQWKVRVTDYAAHLSAPSTPDEARAISCADKIHNIESLLMALERNRERPGKVWKKLKETPQLQIEQFRSLRRDMASVWKSPLLTRFGELIDRLELAVTGHAGQ